jgi:hypothetical protein
VHWPLAEGGTRNGALIGERVVVVAAFTRQPGTLVGDPVLRWSDGAPAAVETSLGSGCVRTVHAGVPTGDATLRPRFLSLVRQLTGPCSDRVRPALASDSITRALVAAPRPGIAPVAAADVRSGVPLAPWLFAAALVAALAEMGMRRRR